MVPAFNPMSCSHLAVPAGVMEHLAQVESGGNRFAIGVVGGRLQHQPGNLGEAVATARMLEAKGYDFSLGIAQVNRSNLSHYGLDTFEKAFDACANLVAGARILAECYGRSGDNWGKAFSCYYSGNFTSGYRDGYVQRILASFAAGPDAAAPATVRPQSMEYPTRNRTYAPHLGTDGPAHRVSIRSVPLDSVGVLMSSVTRTTGSANNQDAPLGRPPRELTGPQKAAASVFVPRVKGPGDPATGGPAPAMPTATGRAHPGQEAVDAAFVF